MPLVIVAAIAAGIFYYRRRQDREIINGGEDIELNKSNRRGTVSKLFRRSGIGKLSPGLKHEQQCFIGICASWF